MNATHRKAEVPGASVRPLPSISTEQLFGNGNQAVLVHRGEYYRLRCTRNGKLILTK